MPTRRAVTAILCLATLALLAGWGARGHRTITLLALDGLPSDISPFFKDPTVRARIAEQASEADRWRGTRLSALTHENDPDHYLDIELLEQFGLTLETVPPLRYDYLRAMAVSKHLHPEMVDDYDRASDPDGSKEWPGFVLHAIAEHYAKLRSSFSTLRILESLDDPALAAHLELARANAVYHMGMLSHFVGDTAQPLHTTKHFNGWAGDNPEGYTTSRRFHAYIDSGIVEHHGFDYDSLRPKAAFERRVNPADPWDDATAYIRRSFEQVEPLYRLDRDGELKAEPGRILIERQLLDAAETLAAMYRAAWEHAEPTEQAIHTFVRFNPLPETPDDPANRSIAPGRRSENPPE
jgi:hypothetical protein